jgi:hypothetical protein
MEATYMPCLVEDIAIRIVAFFIAINRLYAFLGSEKLGTVFARYDISNSSWNTTLPFNWTSTADGASLVAGGEYLYALRG